MRTDAEAFSVDANVILRFLLRDHDELSPKARATIEAAAGGHIAIVLDPVLLAEVVWVLTSYYELSRAEIAAGLEPILKMDGVAMENKERYMRALEIYGSTQAHFGDACACAAALEDCNGRLISFDRKLSEVEGISRTESPDNA